jgi:hypothetical protein
MTHGNDNPKTAKDAPSNTVKDRSEWVTGHEPMTVARVADTSEMSHSPPTSRVSPASASATWKSKAGTATPIRATSKTADATRVNIVALSAVRRHGPDIMSGAAHARATIADAAGSVSPPD